MAHGGAGATGSTAWGASDTGSSPQPPLRGAVGAAWLDALPTALGAPSCGAQPVWPRAAPPRWGVRPPRERARPCGGGSGGPPPATRPHHRPVPPRTAGAARGVPPRCGCSRSCPHRPSPRPVPAAEAWPLLQHRGRQAAVSGRPVPPACHYRGQPTQLPCSLAPSRRHRLGFAQGWAVRRAWPRHV